MGPVTIVSFVGYQGSGKSLLGRRLSRILGTDHIEISDIVKAIHDGLTREELAATGDLTEDDPTWLGKEVAVEVERVRDEQNRDVVVISGVREVEVHNYLQNAGYHIWAVEVTADPDLRYSRLVELKKVKNAVGFIEQDLRERLLGLDKVLATTKYVIETSEKTSADALAKATINHLETKGAEF